MKTQAVSRASFAEFRLLDVIETQLASSMVILPYFYKKYIKEQAVITRVPK